MFITLTPGRKSAALHRPAELPWVATGAGERESWERIERYLREREREKKREIVKGTREKERDSWRDKRKRERYKKKNNR